MKKMLEHILIFLKGLLMGICDIIPGVSGGTIAFITGIYERLILAVKSFSFNLLKDFFLYIFGRNRIRKRALIKDIKSLDLAFLIVLVAGIGTAILAMSHIITFLLESYFAFTISFFVGLILASSKIIFDHIKNHHLTNVSFGLIGLIIGVALAFLIPATVTVTLPYVFLGGFIAISAMFLPGISGAFILFIMGLYEFLLNILHDVTNNLSYLFTFLIGAVLGALFISRIIAFLFKRDKCKTLYVLLGLVIGALSIPVKKVLTTAVWTAPNIAIMLGLLILGVIAVFAVNKLEKKIE